MQSDEETKELLREIRDALISHTNKYEAYLMEFDKRADLAKEDRFHYWGFMLIVIFLAVVLAIKVTS